METKPTRRAHVTQTRSRGLTITYLLTSWTYARFAEGGRAIPPLPASGSYYRTALGMREYGELKPGRSDTRAAERRRGLSQCAADLALLPALCRMEPRAGFISDMRWDAVGELLASCSTSGCLILLQRPRAEVSHPECPAGRDTFTRPAPAHAHTRTGSHDVCATRRTESSLFVWEVGGSDGWSPGG